MKAVVSAPTSTPTHVSAMSERGAHEQAQLDAKRRAIARQMLMGDKLGVAVAAPVAPSPPAASVASAVVIAATGGGGGDSSPSSSALSVKMTRGLQLMSMIDIANKMRLDTSTSTAALFETLNVCYTLAQEADQATYFTYIEQMHPEFRRWRHENYVNSMRDKIAEHIANDAGDAIMKLLHEIDVNRIALPPSVRTTFAVRALQLDAMQAWRALTFNGTTELDVSAHNYAYVRIVAEASTRTAFPTYFTDVVAPHCLEQFDAYVYRVADVSNDVHLTRRNVAALFDVIHKALACKPDSLLKGLSLRVSHIVARALEQAPAPAPAPAVHDVGDDDDDDDDIEKYAATVIADLMSSHSSNDSSGDDDDDSVVVSAPSSQSSVPPKKRTATSEAHNVRSAKKARKSSSSSSPAKRQGRTIKYKGVEYHIPNSGGSLALPLIYIHFMVDTYRHQKPTEAPSTSKQVKAKFQEYAKAVGSKRHALGNQIYLSMSARVVFGDDVQYTHRMSMYRIVPK